MAGQVCDLAWSLSLLARSWNSDVDLRTASRHSCLNAPPRAAHAVNGFRAEEASRGADRWSKPARFPKNNTE